MAKGSKRAAWSNLWAMSETVLRRLVAAATAPEQELEEQQAQEQLEPYTVNGGIAVIPVVGCVTKYQSILSDLMGGVSTVNVQNALGAATADDGVDAVLLWVDSPGGEVAGVSDLADQIAACPKPVYAYVSDQACSAAYWIASAADKVYVNRAGFVGSIGVYSTICDESKAAEGQGIKVTIVKAGEFKGIGEPGTEVTPDQLAILQNEVDSIYNLFVGAVAEGRGMTPDAVRRLATGETYIADKALTLGLVDGVCGGDQIMQTIQGDMMANKVEDKPVDEQQDKPAEDVQPVEEQQKPDEQVDPATDTQPAEEQPNPDDVKKEEQARLAQIIDICKGDLAFAVECYQKGMTVDEAKLAYAEKAIANAATLAKEVAKLKADAGGAKPLATAGVNVARSTDDQIKAEWENNKGDVRKRFTSFANYKAFAKRYGNK